MSWVYDNKFVVGVGAAMLAGAGVLGYLTMSASDSYAAASTERTAAAEKLKEIEGKKPFPSEAYLKELGSEKQELNDKLNALQENFKKRVLPIKPVTKEAFQDRLKETVAAVTAGFAKSEIDPPARDFYLGYTEYRDKPPEDAAAPLLARQLRAIELVMELLIQEGQLKLKELTREPFTEERSKSKALEPKPAPPKPGPPKPGSAKPAADKAGKQLVEKTGFTIKVIGSDDAFRRIVNGIVGHKKQIFIIRRIEAQNEKPVPPQKTMASAPTAPAPTAPAAAPATPAPTPAPPAPTVTLEYLFGKEQVAATIDIEVLDFAEPEKRSAKVSDGKKN